MLAALGRSIDDGEKHQISTAVARGADWLMHAVAGEVVPSPVGLYFARLWYYEELYPVVFALEGLAGARTLVRLEVPGTGKPPERVEST